MKIIFLLTIIVLSLNSLFGQENEWFSYDFDSIISIDMPGNVNVIDTTMNGEKLYHLFSTIKNSVFITQKMLLEETDFDKNLSKLPYDDKSLEKTYAELITGISKAIPSKLKSMNKVLKDNFKGYNLVFVDSLMKPIIDYNLYILDKYMYSIVYLNANDFNEIEKNKFINSITIKSKNELIQFSGKTSGF
jgi:hypothetical protein